MDKKILWGGLFLTAVVFIGSGCIYQKMTSSEESSNEQSEETPERDRMRQMFDEERFNKLTADDLAVGKVVMAIGQENNGLTVADNIVLGDEGSDPNELMSGFGPARMMSASDTPLGDRAQSGGEQGDWEDQRAQFENMSEEDREAMRQEMMNRNAGMPMGGPSEGGGFREAGSGQTGTNNQVRTPQAQMSRVAGTIMEVSDNSITVSLSDGGSKIIYFSADTGIWSVKEKQED